MPNWRALGPDFVQGFWLKKFKSIQEGLGSNLEKCFKNGNMPMWMTKGRIILMQKDKRKGEVASNYRPITCLSLVLKQIKLKKKFMDLWIQMWLPLEQKGCRRKSRRTNDLLFIDKIIMWEVKIRMQNLSIAGIDYKKAYDVVPHSWIIDRLETVGINEKIWRLLAVWLLANMKSWWVELTSGEKNLWG